MPTLNIQVAKTRRRRSTPPPFIVANPRPNKSTTGIVLLLLVVALGLGGALAWVLYEYVFNNPDSTTPSPGSTPGPAKPSQPDTTDTIIKTIIDKTGFSYEVAVFLIVLVVAITFVLVGVFVYVFATSGKRGNKGVEILSEELERERLNAGRTPAEIREEFVDATNPFPTLTKSGRYAKEKGKKFVSGAKYEAGRLTNSTPREYFKPTEGSALNWAVMLWGTLAMFVIFGILGLAVQDAVVFGVGWLLGTLVIMVIALISQGRITGEFVKNAPSKLSSWNAERKARKARAAANVDPDAAAPEPEAP